MQKAAFALPRWTTTAIVLGSGVTSKNRLPHDAKTRLRKALLLWKQGYFSTFLLSGGRTNEKSSYSQAGLMKIWLLERGVPPENIVVEERAKDTLGNAIHTLPFIKETHVLLVTSDYHLPRALDIFTHVYGPKYAVYGVASHPFLAHHLFFKMREWQLEELTQYCLEAIEPGDITSAKKALVQVESFLKNNKLG